jgi:hypothetical protein
MGGWVESWIGVAAIGLCSSRHQVTRLGQLADGRLELSAAPERGVSRLAEQPGRL